MPFQNKNQAIMTIGAARLSDLAVLVAVVSGLGISLALFFAVRSWDQSRFQTNFERESLQAASVLKEGIDNHLDVLRALQAFYLSSEEITREEFRIFTGDFLKREAGVQAIEWIPRVPQNERETYEKAAQDQGFPNFKITQKDDSGTPVGATERPEYYPVYFLEPYKGNEIALGFDLASGAVRRQSLYDCRDTGNLTATPPIILVQERENQQGFLVFQPVYRRGAVVNSVESRRENLVGFYAVVFHYADFIRHVLGRHRFSGICLYVFDQSMEQQEPLLFFDSFGEGVRLTKSRREAEVKAGPYFAESHTVGGREWSILFTPTPSLLSKRRTWLPWITLAVCALITSLASVYIAQMQRGAETARQHAQDQSAAREALEQEMARRVVTEQTLLESERRYRTLFESATDAIFMMEAEGPDTGRIVAANQAAAEIYGYTREEIYTLNIRDLNTPESTERIPDRIHRLLQGEHLREEAMHLKKDGTVFPIEINARSIELEGRNYILGMNRDDTERKAQEVALKQRDAEQRALLDNIPDLAWLKDHQGRFISVNESFAKACGLEVKDLPGKTDMDIWPQALAQAYRSDDAEVMDSGKTKRVVEPLADQEGRIQWIETIKNPIRDDFGHVSGTAGIARDITDSKQAEEALRESEIRYRTVANFTYDWEYWVDPERKFLYVSPACHRVTGYTDQEFIDDPTLLQRIIHPDDLGLFEAHVQAESPDEYNFQESFDFRIIHRSGETVWINHVCTPVHGDDEKSLGWRVSNRDISDRKQAETALQESEERFRTAFLTSPDAITLSRLSGTDQGFYVDVNDGFCDLSGYTRNEVIGRSTVDLDLWCNPKDRVALLAGLRERGQVANLEAQFCLKDRQTKICLISARIVNISGQPHVLAVTRDVDQWKKTEEALHVSEERFRQVAEVAGEWIWEVDETGLFRYSSSAVQQVLGYSPVELVGQRHFWEFFEDTENRDSGRTAQEIFARGELFQRFRASLVRKDGEIVILEASGSPILDTDGTLRGYRGTSTDVTERVRAAESQKLLVAVVEHASESIVVTDTQGAIQYVNPAFEQISGYTKQEATGLNPRVLKSGKHDDRFYKALWKTITEGNVWQGHFINKKKDGALFEEDATISPLKDSQGEITNYVAVKRDVTKEVSLQRQLAQSQKMEAIGTLAGGIAHDFNNILFGIIGYTELAMDDQPEGSRALQNLERVLAASKRAGDMTQQILLFSRQGDYDKQLLDLTPIVKESLKFLRGSIPATIEIRPHIGTALGRVEADPTQIHQVLMNLCTNAAYAMKDTQGVLTVELSEVTLDADLSARHLSMTPGKYIKLAVSDTGHGIAPYIIEHIFEPYFTTKKVGEGTGMGLAVIHGIVTSHGGTITVFSVPGEGSTFNVFLPVVEREVESKADAIPEVALRGRERILYVDDEPLLAEMGEAMLKRLGYDVVSTTNPVEALEIFRSDPQRFHLVITDLIMPKMTGAELGAEIIDLRPDMPMILCTGFGHKFTEEEARERGFGAVIKKPISKREVAQTVRKVLDENSDSLSA